MLEYSFETEDGTKTLADLFDGRSQLLVHHFMFGPKYTARCPICSSAADTIDGTVIRPSQRDVRLVRVSRAPLEKLLADKQRIGWPFPWVRSLRSDFGFDFDVSATEEQQQPLLERGNLGPVAYLAADCGTDPAGYLAEAPGISAFAPEHVTVYHPLLDLRARNRGPDRVVPAVGPGHLVGATRAAGYGSAVTTRTSKAARGHDDSKTDTKDHDDQPRHMEAHPGGAELRRHSPALIGRLMGSPRPMPLDALRGRPSGDPR